jgi:K+-sensing histidine kinase KdpD
MIEWVPLGSGPRPVPRPVAAPLVWAAAFGGALVLVAVLNAVAGPGRTGLALSVLSLLAALLGLCARFTAAPGTAVLCWLSLNGFAIPPAGTLTWTGSRDTVWLACLLVAALTGTALARLVHARAAYRRLTTARAAEASDPCPE